LATKDDSSIGGKKGNSKIKNQKKPMTPAPKTNGLTTPQSTIDREKEALKLSKVVSIDECERFDFVFDDTDFNGNACRNSIRHAEGILINPRWATYKFNYKE